MPGTIPATSQLDRLISMTAINVLAGSRAMRDRLKLFNVCMGSSIGSQRTMDAISTPPPHSIFHPCPASIRAQLRDGDEGAQALQIHGLKPMSDRHAILE